MRCRTSAEPADWCQQIDVRTIDNILKLESHHTGRKMLTSVLGALRNRSPRRQADALEQLSSSHSRSFRPAASMIGNQRASSFAHNLLASPGEEGAASMPSFLSEAIAAGSARAAT